MNLFCQYFWFMQGGMGWGGVCPPINNQAIKTDFQTHVLCQKQNAYKPNQKVVGNLPGSDDVPTWENGSLGLVCFRSLPSPLNWTLGPWGMELLSVVRSRLEIFPLSWELEASPGKKLKELLAVGLSPDSCTNPTSSGRAQPLWVQPLKSIKIRLFLKAFYILTLKCY